VGRIPDLSVRREGGPLAKDTFDAGVSTYNSATRVLLFSEKNGFMCVNANAPTTSRDPQMTTFYVATRSAYVLVDADDETKARELGHPALAKLFRESLGREAQFEIRLVRLATADEIKLMEWHNEKVAQESK
jgi:hypothetical protein